MRRWPRPRSQTELDRPGACRGCAFHACRANPEPGAARSYWGNARVPILTHGAYWAHRLFKPDANTFDGLVCDEVPDFIYRTPAIRVMTEKTFSGEASWTVEPLDAVLHIFEKGRKWRDPPAGVQAAVSKLRERREVLVKQASKLRSEVQQKDRSPFENKVADFEPLLSEDEFKSLAQFMSKAARKATSMEQVLGALDALSNEPDHDLTAADEPSEELLDPLANLWDFCADTPAFSVLERQEFERDGGGALSIVRPVNGWDSLLLGPDGASRRSVLLDATAGIDPRYMLAGAFEEEVFPSEDFPATTLVLYSEKTVTTTTHRQKSPEVVVTEVARELGKQRVARDARLLLVTDKSMDQGLQRAVLALQRAQPGLLPDDVRVDHFGNLRGKNEYIECDAVYFTHIFRKPEDCYLGLELLLGEFEGYPRQWLTKNDSAWRDRPPEVLARSLVCDLYQDLMRINIRHRPSAPAVGLPPDQRPEACRAHHAAHAGSDGGRSRWQAHSLALATLAGAAARFRGRLGAGAGMGQAEVRVRLTLTRA